MSDMFANKRIDPMLIKNEAAPFNDINYIYELKLDGTRCLAYLDNESTDLRNKRYVHLTPIFPELQDIHRQAKEKCILDGELIVQGSDGKPNFADIQRRCLMSNAIKINLASKKAPATFIAYDILYLNGDSLLELPLMERKALLQATVQENKRIAISRYISEHGIDLYELTVNQNLEGIVAKKKDSIYVPGKRSKAWIKIKNMCDDDYVIVGYLFKERGKTLILAQYNSQKQLIYKGHVTGISAETFKRVTEIDKYDCPLLPPIPDSNHNAIWIKPELVCKVEYMHKTANGGLRQPVFRGLRDDKLPGDCITKEES